MGRGVVTPHTHTHMCLSLGLRLVVAYREKERERQRDRQRDRQTLSEAVAYHSAPAGTGWSLRYSAPAAV